VRNERLLWAALVCLSLVYLLQLASPLRLNIDSIHLLTVGHSVAEGHGYLYRGLPSRYPKLYPLVVAILERTGTANSVSLVALNLIMLGLGLWAVSRICQKIFHFQRWQALAVVCASLLSYVLVKYTVVPMSDTMGFGFAMLALWAILSSREHGGGRRLAFLGAGALLSWAALSARINCIALVPAWGFALLPENLSARRILSGMSRRSRIIAVVAMLVVVALVGYSLVTARQFEKFVNSYEHGGILFIAWQSILGTFIEWGQIFFNVPESKLYSVFGRGPVKAIMPYIGALAVYLLVRAVWLNRKNFSAAEVFLLAYTGILVFWPSRDPRLWLAVIPLLYGFVAASLRSASRFRLVRLTIGAYLVAFSIAGIGALYYNTGVSLSGDSFPDRYGDGSLTATYDSVYTGRSLPPAQGDLRPEEMADVLGLYDSRAHKKYRTEARTGR